MFIITPLSSWGTSLEAKLIDSMPRKGFKSANNFWQSISFRFCRDGFYQDLEYPTDKLNVALLGWVKYRRNLTPNPYKGRALISKPLSLQERGFPKRSKLYRTQARTAIFFLFLSMRTFRFKRGCHSSIYAY